MDQLPSTDQHITIKFIHQQLPLNGHPSQTEYGRQEACPCCNQTEETFSHYCNCPALIDQWNTGHNNIIQSARSTNFDPTLIQLITETLQHGSPLPTTTAQLDDRYKKHVLDGPNYSQDDGRENGYDCTTMIRHRQEKPGQAQLLQPQWREQAKIWRHRCNLAHKEETMVTKQTAIDKVKSIYHIKPQLNKYDSEILNRPLESVLQMPERHLRAWYHSVALFVKDGLQSAKKCLKQGNQSIAQFFPSRSRITHIINGTE